MPIVDPTRNVPAAALYAFALLSGSNALVAHAQSSNFPTRPVTLIVPFSAGGGTDVVARTIAPKLTEIWGQQVIVDNRTGASGTIGLQVVNKAAPDGHTIGMMIITHATNAAMLGAKSPIDLVRDFSPISQVVGQPYALMVNASIPARSVKELVSLAKTRPGALTYGSSGVGGVLHLAGELLSVRTNIRITHVPYKGSAPSVADVAGGHIVMAFCTLMSAQPLVARGRTRVLGITAKERLAIAPDIPTVEESGLTGPFEVSGWYGIAAPPNTPSAVVEKISRDVARVIKLADVRDRMLGEAFVPTSSTPAQFGEMVRGEVDLWKRIIKQAGVSPDAR
jgi:tripartite-type tricarboxylate transporter receptor subunit TctC